MSFTLSTHEVISFLQAVKDEQIDENNVNNYLLALVTYGWFISKGNFFFIIYNDTLKVIIIFSEKKIFYNNLHIITYDILTYISYHK